MADVYPTFPYEFRGGYERIPSEMIQVNPGESTQLLLDTQKRPVARVVTINRRDVNAEALNKIPKDEAELYVDLLHQRDESGRVRMPGRNYMYFTTSPALSDEEAVDDVFKMLTANGVYQTRTERPGAQAAIEIGAPGVLGALGGGVGATLGNVPGALIGSEAGNMLGNLIAHLTRPLLDPNVAESDDPIRNNELLYDLLLGAGQGALGEIVTQTPSALGRATRKLTVKGVDITPEERALFLPGGPYEKAAEMTGEKAYGRIGGYVRGTLREIDRYVAGALFARTRSEDVARTLQKNKDAFLTDYVREINATGETASVGERILQWLDTRREPWFRRQHPDSLREGATAMQQGMYTYAQSLADASGGVNRVNTDPVLDWARERAPMEGIRYQDRQIALQRILRKIVPDGETRTVTQAENQSVALTADGVTETQGTRGRTQVTPQGRSETQTEFESTVIREPGSVEREGSARTEATRERFPLNGLLSTLDGDNITNEIGVGRARQIIQSAKQAAREESDPYIRSALERFTDILSRQTESALRRMGADVQLAFKNADTFTAQMYQTIAHDVIQADVVNALAKNPESFAAIATHPRSTHIISAMKDAFYFGQRINPALLPPGTQIPPQLKYGAAFFDNVVMPEMQFQALKELAFDPQMHARLMSTAALGGPMQDLIKDNRLLTLEAGKIIKMQAALGEETFEALMGGKEASKKWIQLDYYLLSGTRPANAFLSGKPQGDIPLSLAVVMGQVGGASLAATALYKLTHGQIVQGLTELLGSGVLLFTAPFINKQITKPEFFEKLVLGLHLRNDDPRKFRFLANLGVASIAHGIRGQRLKYTSSDVTDESEVSQPGQEDSK